jgi:YHS domain-containing protein
MHKSHRFVILALGLGLGAGCTGEDAGTAPPAGPSSSPAVKTALPPAGTAPTITPSAPIKNDTTAPSSTKDEGKKADAPSLEGPKTGEAGPGKLTDEEVAQIKKLPPDKQAIALKQVSCPVSGEHLGGMGAPVKAEIDGRTFFLCCKSCQADVKNDPKGVLAKLDKK